LALFSGVVAFVMGMLAMGFAFRFLLTIISMFSKGNSPERLGELMGEAVVHLAGFALVAFIAYKLYKFAIYCWNIRNL
jgi:hypothetical protein